MPASTEKLVEIEDQVVETLNQFQEPVLSTVRRAVELVDGVVPEMKIPNGDRLPSAKDIIDNQYEFASRLLKLNHEFALALLEAVKPIELKVLPEAKPAPKAKKSASKPDAAAA